MKRFYFLIFLVALTTNLWASEKKKAPKACKEGYSHYSCSDVKKARRMGFCWKGEIAQDKKEKVCKSKKKKKSKKKAKA